MRSPRAGPWYGRMWRRCCWCRSAPTPFSQGLWWYHRNRCWQQRLLARRAVRAVRAARRVPCCGATAAVPSTCRLARGSKSGVASGRCFSPGCSAAPDRVRWVGQDRPTPALLSVPSDPVNLARGSERHSPTGWWRSSASRSPGGAAGRMRGRTLPRGWETRSRLAMLEEVRISGLGVIDEAVLELSPGFNVVTGETGAGKTMVVSGLGLLFGGRADPARVRPGADRASVEGRLSVAPDGPVARQVDESGGDLDDGGAALILSRSVSAEGRSRAYAGGRAVPVSLLISLADDLVAVHGQADQQQLLKPGRQREALDRFAGAEFGALLARYQRAYQRHRDVRNELDELTSRAREREHEAEDLRRGLAEIERLEPVEGEDLELFAEEQRLSHADALHSAATTAHEALLGDPSSGSYEAADAVTLLAAARQALEAAAHHDTALAALGARVSEAAYLVSDVAADLASYAQSVEADPVRLAAVQERRAELTRLIRQFGATVTASGEERADGPGPGGAGSGEAGEDSASGVSAVLSWARRAGARLAELDGADDRI